MSRCDNCIHYEKSDVLPNQCHKGHYCADIRNIFGFNCDDFEHWNKVNGDDV